MKIFKSYKATSNTNFVDYIEKKEDAYLDGKDFDPDEVMQLVLNKYVFRRTSREWRGTFSVISTAHCPYCRPKLIKECPRPKEAC